MGESATKEGMDPRLRRLLETAGPERTLSLADVGSMGGPEAEWRELLAEGFARAEGFEPDPREFARLPKGGAVPYHHCALAERSGAAMTLHIAREPGKTSVYEPNLPLLRRFPRAERWEIVGTRALEGGFVRTLDETVSGADFLKLDTQGSELDILRGGPVTVSKALGLKVEVEFLELYKGQPLFADVDRFLRASGFELVDLRRVFWKRRELGGFFGKGQLVFGDALYLRPPESVPPERAAAYAALCLLYGMRDWAAALNLPGALGTALRAPDAAYALRVPGRNRLLRWGRALSRFLSRSDQGFSDGDVGLGN